MNYTEIVYILVNTKDEISSKKQLVEYENKQ